MKAKQIMEENLPTAETLQETLENCSKEQIKGFGANRCRIMLGRTNILLFGRAKHFQK